MKIPIAIAIVLVGVVALISIAVVIHRVGQDRRQARAQEVAREVFEVGGGLPASLNSITQGVHTSGPQTAE